jgi:low temperature requirement protein LtrA
VDERRTTPVELFWDLVFVFAVTQVTAFLARDLSWTGFGRGMLLLALVWWAWSAYVWAANAEHEGSRALRAVLLLGMVLVFVAGLSLPQAFGDSAWGTRSSRARWDCSQSSLSAAGCPRSG